MPQTSPIQRTSPQPLDQQAQDKLHQQLQQELALTNSLQLCLTDERKALEENDADGLIECADKKDKLVNQLEISAQQRDTLLQQCSVPPSREGMQQLLSNCNNSQLQQARQNLSTAAEQCHEDNRQLGMLIQREQDNIHKALHILQRGTPSSNHSYDANGQSDSNTKTRNLAKA